MSSRSIAVLTDYMCGGLPPGVSLRQESNADVEFMASLFALTRNNDLAQFELTEDLKRAFLRTQFEYQRIHHRAHFPASQGLIVLLNEVPIGRISLEKTQAGIRLLDVTLLPANRGQGIGSSLLAGIISYADAHHCSISLHVEPRNPALKLYERLGFAILERHAAFLLVGRNPRSPMV